MPEQPVNEPRKGAARTLVALIVAQVCLHSALAGVRMATPLHALREGYSAWGVGVLMALFAAAPVVLALHAGRLADRYGVHRPMGIAVALTAGGAGCAVLSTWLPGAWHFGFLCVGATLCGAGANMGLISIQRTAGRSVSDSTERMRVFSWLGLAPAIANVVGSVSAGVLIDTSGFRAAFGLMVMLPLGALWCLRRVPREPVSITPHDPRRTAWDLWRMPGLARLMVVNWLLSACWDVHSFAVPILGHERGFSASTIGVVLGVFPLAVSGVRVVIPLVAHRMDEATVLRGAMLGTGIVFAAYPLVHSAWLMAGCAVLLGVMLGAVQPMIMSTLHHLTPEHRHGEAIALRSMTINASSTLMPLIFGVAGSAVGAGPLFWLMGAAVGAGSLVVRPASSAQP